MNDGDLRDVALRLDALAERVSEIGDAQDRNDDAVAQLAAAVSDLVTRLRRQDRTLSLNSFVAYAIFTVLLGTAFFMLYRGRAESLVRERDQAVAALAAAQERDLEATRKLASREAADTALASFFEYFRDHRYKEAIEAEVALASLELPPAQRGLVADAALRARAELAKLGLDRSLEALRRKDFDRALKEAQAAIAVAPKSEHIGELHYAVGASLAKLGRAEEALLEIEKALAAGAERKTPDVRYVHATVLDKLGRMADARVAYRAFVTSAPRDPKASWARQRLWDMPAKAK